MATKYLTKEFKNRFSPLEILVGIDRAWKKDVFSGPRPVLWAGMTTDKGAMAPGRAGARTLFSSSLSRTCLHNVRSYNDNLYLII